MTTLLLICSAVISESASAAAAPAPTGKLTAAEYRQLSAGQAALDRAVSGKAVNWAKARAGCRTVGITTALLRTQRASCLESTYVLDALASFPHEQRRCSTTNVTTTTTSTVTTGTASTTSTTGTTTTPASSTVVAQLICMSPHYRALARFARTLDSDAIASRSTAVARGFSDACLAALAPSRDELRSAKLFASSTGRLAADVTALIRVTEGKTPAGGLDQARIRADVRQFESSATAVLDEHGQPKLSVCPHQ